MGRHHLGLGGRQPQAPEPWFCPAYPGWPVVLGWLSLSICSDQIGLQDAHGWEILASPWWLRETGPFSDAYLALGFWLWILLAPTHSSLVTPPQYLECP